MEPETDTAMATFDSLIEDRQLQMMKAAIPYVNNSSKRTVAFLIKLMELEHTVSIFNEPAATLQICSAPEADEPRPLQLLGALREYCTQREQETIDLLLNYIQMFSAYGTLFNQ